MKIAPIAALALVAACSGNAEANPIQRLVPLDAKSIEAKTLAGGRQISFDAERDYPTSGIRREGVTEFQREGWRYCSDSAEALQWSTFLRGDGASAERIFQRLTYLKKGDRLITIGERYVVKGEQLSGASSRPTARTQKVVIVDAVYKAKDVAELTAGTKCE